MVHRPSFAQLLRFGCFVCFAQAVVSHQLFNGFFYIAAQHNVGTATSHVRGDGDGTGRTSLRHDIGFAGMLLGVEHLVLEPSRLEHAREQFRQFNGSGSHQHRLASAMAFFDVVNRCLVFLFGGFVDAVELVFTSAGFVGWNDDGF